MYSTNYYNTLIQVPSTCTLTSGTFPTQNEIAQLQFDLLYHNPYEFVSDDLLYLVYAKLNDIFEEDFEHEKKSFFSQPNDCMLQSPLVHNFGWGIHNNNHGFMSLIGKETSEYHKLSNDSSIIKLQPIQITSFFEKI